MIWNQRGGSGDCTVLLLHGLGATGAVWAGLQNAIEQTQTGNWLTVDLGGHGGSSWHDTYTVETLAAEIEPLLRKAETLYIVGHSLGAYVGLALANPRVGLSVRGVLGIGPKVQWSAEDLAAAKELASRAPRIYPQEADATARYRRVSGLGEDIAADARPLERGIVKTAEGFRLSQDPKTFSVGGAPFEPVLSEARAQVLLARGARDAMVSNAELRAFPDESVEIPGAGHNAHVEKPEAVVQLLKDLIARG